MKQKNCRPSTSSTALFFFYYYYYYLYLDVVFFFLTQIEDECKLGSPDEIASTVHQILSFINGS
jgi:hypothetical protein